MNFHFLQILSYDLTGYWPPTCTIHIMIQSKFLPHGMHRMHVLILFCVGLPRKALPGTAIKRSMQRENVVREGISWCGQFWFGQPIQKS